MEVNFEQILEHSNQNGNYIKSDIARIESQKLNWKESEKKWSVLEVVGHLNKVYDLYFPNFQKAIESAPENNGQDNILQRTLMGRLSIYTQKPKGQKVRFKMKTFSFFQPSTMEAPLEVIQQFLTKKEQFNDFIKQARLKDLKGIKMPTALGDKMKFYVPECFEFILAHEDRHLVQIQNILSKAS